MFHISNFKMTIYILAIYMFFICMLGKNAYANDIKQAISRIKAKESDDYMVVSDSVPTDLDFEPLGTTDGEGINSYRFLRVAFQDKLFAFQRTTSEEKETDLFVWVSADKGISWGKIKTAKCILEEAGGKCDVASTMIVNNELVVIYANKKEQVVVNSKDGENWNVGEAISRDFMADKEIVYYSGIPSDIPEFKDENKYVACYLSDEVPDEKKKDDYVTAVVCAVSDDAKENSWKQAFYMLINKSISQTTKLGQIYFLQDAAYFIASIDTEKYVFFMCIRQSKPDTKGAVVVMQCDPSESDPQERVPVLDVNCDKDSSTMVLDATEAYTLGYLSEKRIASGDLLKITEVKRGIEKRDLRTAVVGSNGKGKTVKKMEEVEKGKPIAFRIVYVTEFALSVMYEYEKKIYNINSEVKKMKRGCLFVKDQGKKQGARLEDDKYTQTVFYDEIDSQSDKYCQLDNFEPVEEDTYVSFFVKVPATVDFEGSENCFKHSHVEEEENESPKHGRSIIKVKNIIEYNEDPDNKMREYEFIYPASLHNLMKYNKKVTCVSKSFKFIVAYMFQGDEKVVKRMKFDTVDKDFTNEDNRLSLQDYAWNISIPETTTGSFVVDSTNYMKRFQVYVDLLNNKPNAVDDFAKFKLKFPTEMHQYIVLSEEEQDTEQYAGIDFTNSSKHYEKFEEDITGDSVLSRKVIVPEEGIIVGLICPLEDSDSLGELHCFDEVTDMEDKRVLFEEFASDIPVSILPKIMVYNQKAMGVESVLRLNKESYDALDKLDHAIQFRCECKLNTHKVTIKFAIGTDSSIFPDETDIEPIPGPLPLPPKPEPSKSTRSILSSAVVLLVLLNVFSCISFLN